MSDASTNSPSPRVLISYAHDNPKHDLQVEDFWRFLRSVGIDACIDVPAAERPQEWPLWMLGQVKLAHYVLVIASPEYRRRADGEATPGAGLGVQWESRLLREFSYADPEFARSRILPVVLPGRSASEIPLWLGPVGSMHFAVDRYDEAGAAKLLRYLRGQSNVPVPPLGQVRRPGNEAASYASASRAALLRQLSNPSAEEATDGFRQALVRQLLLSPELGISQRDLGLDLLHGQEGTRRIVIERAGATIEVWASLQTASIRSLAESELAKYGRERRAATGRREAMMLTDGARWYVYRLPNVEVPTLALVDTFEFNQGALELEPLFAWLGSILGLTPPLDPRPEDVKARLGAGSPGYKLMSADLAELYEACSSTSSIVVKRQLWAQLLTTSMGNNFTNDDSLFIDHTLLVLMAEIIGHAVVGELPPLAEIDASQITSGERFLNAEIWGVVERDFFDWIAEAPDGSQYVRDLARRLMSFQWRLVHHDVLKVLYESIISAEVRKRLGEYYTPDWLAAAIVESTVTDPVAQTVMDASCGSGTFLFHAIRRYLAAADEARLSNVETLSGLTRQVLGIDVHPVAVTLARVTYLLAIGMDRLQAQDRPSLSIPVYLGDSLHWGEEKDIFSYPGFTVSTNETRELADHSPEDESEQLRFPSSVVDDANRFDQLVTEMADHATLRERGSPPPRITLLLKGYGIQGEDAEELSSTFQKMCMLHDDERNHIWAYYVRNLARPLWLSRPANRIDVLVGNPPWLFYRYMTQAQKAAYQSMCKVRGLWHGSNVATSQDLSALFVARCIELYLRDCGSFGYVMPWTTLRGGAYAGFRTGRLSTPTGVLNLSFDQPWDLHKVKPNFFPNSACVIFGHRDTDEARPLADTPEVWSGKVKLTSYPPVEPVYLARSPGEQLDDSGRRSPYASRFFQGAALVPRLFFVVEPADASNLGSGPGRRHVRSERTSNEHLPWKSLKSLTGSIESQFLRPYYAGESLLPFASRSHSDVIVPWDGERLLSNYGQLQHFRGISKWWREAEDLWVKYKGPDARLASQIDYYGKLSRQFEACSLRVIYNTSGMHLSASILSDETAIVDQTLYWGAVESLAEGRYLTAMLNSTLATNLLAPHQTRNKDRRHFAGKVWLLPIPVFQPANRLHRTLVQLAEEAERLSAAVILPEQSVGSLRRLIRAALTEAGILPHLDAVAKEIFN